MERMEMEFKMFFVDEFNEEEWVKIWTEDPRLWVRHYYESYQKIPTVDANGKPIYSMNPKQKPSIGKEGREVIFLLVPKSDD